MAFKWRRLAVSAGERVEVVLGIKGIGSTGPGAHEGAATEGVGRQVRFRRERPRLPCDSAPLLSGFGHP